MSVRENLEVVATFEKAFNERGWGMLGGLCSESILIHDPALPNPLQGRTSFLEMLRTNVEYFPTARIDGVRRFGQDEKVCVQNRETGSQEDNDKGLSYRDLPRVHVEGWQHNRDPLLLRCYGYDGADGRLKAGSGDRSF